MPNVTIQEITNYIEQNIPDFHRRRLESLATLKLRKVLRRKNPYLFKAKFVISAPELVKLILDAHLSSQEETIFGGFLEGLAVFICGRVFSGKKSSAEGIDLEFDRQVHMLADQALGIPYCRFGVAAVVKHDQLDLRLLARSYQPADDLSGK